MNDPMINSSDVQAPGPEMHSSHVCLGGTGVDEPDLGSVDAPWRRLARNQKERTCLFTNVCYDSAQAGWAYYADAHEFTSSERLRFSAGLDVRTG